MPYGSGLTIAGQMKYVNTKSVQIAFTCKRTKISHCYKTTGGVMSLVMTFSASLKPSKGEYIDFWDRFLPVMDD
jgi:hypothetical protein